METKTLPTGTTEYRGFEIMPVFVYAPTSNNFGRADFQVWEQDTDNVKLVPFTTLEAIYADIDEQITERA